MSEASSSAEDWRFFVDLIPRQGRTAACHDLGMTTVERANVITIAPGEPFRVKREWAVFLHRRGRSSRGDGWIELHGDEYRVFARRRGVNGRERLVGSSATLTGAAEKIARRLYPWVPSWRIYDSAPDRAHA